MKENGFEISEVSYEDLVKGRRITFEDLKDHLSGPMLSLVLHIVGLAFLSTLIVFKVPEEQREIEVFEMVVEVKELLDIPKPPEPVEKEEDFTPELPDPEFTPQEAKFEFEEEVPRQNFTDMMRMPEMLVLKMTNSAAVIPISFSLRGGPERDKALKDGGGGEDTEKFLIDGLHWLRDHQNPDGSWGDSNQEYKPALTAFALLAFLAHDERPSSVAFGPTVYKAIRRLVDFVGPEADKLPGGYTHGIVMYALAEAYAMTEIPMLGDIVNKGIGRIISGMNAKGSHNYNYDNSKQRSDLSVAGWNYQALKAAFAAGCAAEGLEAAIDKAVTTGLKRTHFDKDGFCYGEGEGKRPTMTAVGTLCLQLFGEGDSREAKAGLASLESSPNFWFGWKGKDGRAPGWALYQWYYQTQAIFQGHNGKGAVWNRWNRMFKNEIGRRQKSDGRWETPAYEAGNRGGHGEQMFEGLDQPVYATSLSCLMLTVYYRYLPTFRLAETRATSDALAADEDLGLKLEEI